MVLERWKLESNDVSLCSCNYLIVVKEIYVLVGIGKLV